MLEWLKNKLGDAKNYNHKDCYYNEMEILGNDIRTLRNKIVILIERRDRIQNEIIDLLEIVNSKGIRAAEIMEKRNPDDVSELRQHIEEMKETIKKQKEETHEK